MTKNSFINIKKTGAVIAEYNPFHNGHRYQLEKFREESGVSHIVVALSGNFVQRGAPSVFDKFSRAKMAIEGGADLVIEIPAFFATQTAELYARGSVLAVEALGLVDCLCFGSEAGSITALDKSADFLVNRKDYFELSLRKYMNSGCSYVEARERTLKDNIDTDNRDFFRKPNNILGIEYIKELKRIGSSITPVTIRRVESEHNSLSLGKNICSATAIRKIILDCAEGNIIKKNVLENMYDKMGIYVPLSTLYEIKGCIENRIYPMSEEDFFYDIVMSVLREEGRLDRIFEVGEGIENAIRRHCTKSQSLHELIAILTSKRYSSSKIRRTLFNIMFGLEKETASLLKNIERLPYVRVLGFNKKGSEILKKAKETSDAKIITGLAKVMKYEKMDSVFEKLLKFDLMTSNMYYQKYYRYNRKILLKGEPDFIKSVRYGFKK